MRRILFGVAVWGAAMLVAWQDGAVSAQAPATELPRIWTGVYQAVQADRGKAAYSACTDCHGFDLSGGSAPALAGPRFIAKWEGENLSSLFRRIRDTMPRNDPGRLTDQAAVEIVAFILQSNAIPPGNAELRANGEALSELAIVPRTGPSRTTIPNFALVAVIGCLSGTDRAWTLAQATDPAATKDAPATPGELADAAAASGGQRYQLVSVLPFGPTPHNGHKVHVKGLINRTDSGALLNVTALQMVSDRCDR